jgi:hypothetical protein
MDLGWGKIFGSFSSRTSVCSSCFSLSKASARVSSCLGEVSLVLVSWKMSCQESCNTGSELKWGSSYAGGFSILLICGSYQSLHLIFPQATLNCEIQSTRYLDFGLRHRKFAAPFLVYSAPRGAQKNETALSHVIFSLSILRSEDLNEFPYLRRWAPYLDGTGNCCIQSVGRKKVTLQALWCAGSPQCPSYKPGSS